MARANVVLLGPQRLQPTLIQAVDSLGIAGTLATVTAGWEEREGEDQELSDHLRGRALNLRLWARAEEVWQRDAELHRAVRERRETLARLQELYRLRLGHALASARDLLARSKSPQNGSGELASREAELSIDAVRELDEEHVARAAEVHARFEARQRPLERPAVAGQRREIGQELSRCDALCVAGGNVRVLLSRLRLFGLAGLVGARPVIAWSAGAMALAERVALFHDSPPQGAGDTEVLGAGLGVHRGLVAFPHAEKRLRLDDRARLSILARRFRPRLCALLVPGARLDWDGERWSGAARRATEQGALAEVGAP